MKDPLTALKNPRASWENILAVIGGAIAKVAGGEDLSGVRVVVIPNGDDKIPDGSPGTWIDHSARVVTVRELEHGQKLVECGDYYSHLFRLVGLIVTSTAQERDRAANWIGWGKTFDDLDNTERRFLASIDLEGPTPTQAMYNQLAHAQLELRARLFAVCLAEQLLTDHPESELAKRIYRSVWWSAFWDDGKDDTTPGDCLALLLGGSGVDPFLVKSIVHKDFAEFVRQVVQCAATEIGGDALRRKIGRKLDSRLRGSSKEYKANNDLHPESFARTVRETCAKLSIDDAWASLQTLERRTIVRALRDKSWKSLASLLHRNKGIQESAGADRVLVNLVQRYENMGRTEDARNLLHCIIEAFPESRVAREAL